MPDITLIWDAESGRGDWAAADGDVATGSDLETAVAISLFTDATASRDFVPPGGDPRGWWADAYTGIEFGSHLWELERAVKSPQVLLLAKNYASRALQWLIDDGVAATVDVAAEWQGTDTPVLAIGILITKPDGTVTPFRYANFWE